MTEAELNNKLKILSQNIRLMKEKQAEFEQQTKKLADTIEKQKAEIRPIFLESKESMRSEWLIVSYRKGAVRWDTAGLKIYAKTHPEMSVFQKTDEPTVAFYLPKEEE